MKKFTIIILTFTVVFLFMKVQYDYALKKTVFSRDYVLSAVESSDFKNGLKEAVYKKLFSSIKNPFNNPLLPGSALQEMASVNDKNIADLKLRFSSSLDDFFTYFITCIYSPDIPLNPIESSELKDIIIEMNLNNYLQTLQNQSGSLEMYLLTDKPDFSILLNEMDKKLNIGNAAYIDIPIFTSTLLSKADISLNNLQSLISSYNKHFAFEIFTILFFLTACCLMINNIREFLLWLGGCLLTSSIINLIGCFAFKSYLNIFHESLIKNDIYHFKLLILTAAGDFLKELLISSLLIIILGAAIKYISLRIKFVFDISINMENLRKVPSSKYNIFKKTNLPLFLAFAIFAVILAVRNNIFFTEPKLVYSMITHAYGISDLTTSDFKEAIAAACKLDISLFNFIQ